MKKPTHILIVEDVAADADLAQRTICKVLKDPAFEVVETRKDFLKALEVFQPDVILSDYSLPHFNGLTALKLALEHAPLIPFIIWTGSISEDVAVACMKAGANNYVLKENIKRLGPAVVHALEERELLVARKQAEENLAERERQLNMLFSNLPGPVYRCRNDADYTMEFISDNIKKLSGYEAEDFRQQRRHFSKMIHPEDREQVWAEVQAAVAANQPFELTYRIITASGEEKWVWEKGRGIREANGQLQALEGFITDITERKRAEEAVQNNETRFRALIENDLDDISLLNADGTLLWESPSTVHNLGYPPDELLTHNIFELLHPDDLEWTRDLYATLLQEPGSRQGGTFRLRRSDGSWCWVEAVVTNLLNEPSVKAVVVNYRDVTERKEVEARINDLLAFNEKILSYSPVGILTYKLTGECVFANKNAASIIGTVVVQLVSQNFHTIESWKKSGLYDLVQKAIATQAPVTADIHHLSTFGKDVWMTVHCTTFKSKEEDHILLSISDITERKRVEEALRESENRYRTLIETQTEFIVRWRSEGKRTFANEAYCRYFGLTAEQAVFGDFIPLVHEQDRADVEAKIQRLVSGVSEVETDIHRVIKADGSIGWQEWTDQAIHDNNGHLIEFQSVGRDVTARKQAEIERQTLLEIMQGLTNTQELPEFLKLIHDSIARVIYAKNFFVTLYQPNSGMFEEIYFVDQYDPPAPPDRLERALPPISSAPENHFC